MSQWFSFAHFYFFRENVVVTKLDCLGRASQANVCNLSNKFSVPLGPLFVHSCLGVCTSQDKLGYTVEANSPQISVA